MMLSSFYPPAGTRRPNKKAPQVPGGCASGVPTRYGMMTVVSIALIVAQRPGFGGNG
jgi:hypothetical protein